MFDVTVTVWDATSTCVLEPASGPLRVALREHHQGDPTHVVEAVRAALRVDVALLRFSSERTAEVELLDPGLPARPGLRWRERAFQPPTADRMRWQRPGWLRTILAEVDPCLAGSGMSQTGSPVQMRHTNISGMLRIPTDRHEVWLKQLPRMFSHEPAVIRWVAGRAPGTVPTVLGAGPDWWLSSPFPSADGDARDDSLELLAAIQIASIDRSAELMAAGCAVRPPTSLTDELAALTTRDDLVPRRQRVALDTALRALDACFARVESAGFPPTLVHGDFHPENMYWTGDHWFVFDWTDACVTHPLVDLALPLSYLDDAGRARSTAAYAAVWRGVLPAASIDRCLPLAEVLGAAHQATNYRRIVDAVRTVLDPESELIHLLRNWIDRLLSALRQCARR